jgi:hypothetical protein
MHGSFKSIQQPSSENGIVGAQHSKDIEGHVLYSWVFHGAKRNMHGYDPNWLNSFVTKAIDELCWLFQLLLVITHFFGRPKKEDLSLDVIVDEDFGNIPSVDVDSEDHGVGMWERS